MKKKRTNRKSRRKKKKKERKKRSEAWSVTSPAIDVIIDQVTKATA